MSRAIRQHLRSNVVGYIALLCFAMGGTAYATHPGGANTISTADIIDGQVQNADLGPSAVTGPKVSPGTLDGSDVVTGGLLGSDIATDTLGSVDIGANAVGTSEHSTSIPAARVTRTTGQVVPHATAGRSTGLAWEEDDGNRANGFSTMARLVAGDYVELIVSQLSGSSKTIGSFPEYSPEFSMT
ncbi:MAG: hypothetical protein AABM66_01920 [Actinomycetota bacterium]